MLRCFGSSFSRGQSPQRLNAKTTSMIATPGAVVTHQAVDTYSLPSASMEPQAGVGGGMPAPKKLSEASTMMTHPTWSVSRTMRAGITFGKRCRNMIRDCRHSEEAQAERGHDVVLDAAHARTGQPAQLDCEQLDHQYSQP